MAAVAADPREAACYPCVPWFGRLFGGLDFDGRHYDLAPTLPACDPQHALHGHGWVNPWSVTEQAANRLVCRFDYQPAPRGFPFAFSASQEFSVSEHGFEIVLTLTNSSDAPMPAGLGLHPFFPCTKETRLNLVERFAKQISPMQMQPPESIDHSGPIPDDAIDYTLKHWDSAAEIIHDGMRIALRSNAPHLHLYSPEAAGFFCAEPITHMPGHFGGDILFPSAEMRLTLLFTVDPANSDINA